MAPFRARAQPASDPCAQPCDGLHLQLTDSRYVEIEHLRPNRRLLHLLDRVTRTGLRVVALSDTYLNRADLGRILGADRLKRVNPVL